MFRLRRQEEGKRWPGMLPQFIHPEKTANYFSANNSINPGRIVRLGWIQLVMGLQQKPGNNGTVAYRQDRQR